MRSYTDHSSWLRALAMGPDGCPGVELFAIPPCSASHCPLPLTLGLFPTLWMGRKQSMDVGLESEGAEWRVFTHRCPP